MSNKGDFLGILSGDITKYYNVDIENIKVKQEVKQEGNSLADTIRRLAAGYDNKIGDFKMKQEVTIGKPTTKKYDGKKLGVAGGLWCHNRDPCSHIREFKRWKNALKESALEFHAVQIMKAVIGEKRKIIQTNIVTIGEGRQFSYCLHKVLQGRV